MSRHLSLQRVLLFWLVLAFSIPSLAVAQTKSLEVRRTDLAIKIDGVLDDPAWSDAVVTDDFGQVNPIEGGVPSERTVLRVLQDGEVLYFAIRMEDAEPEKLITKQMVLDGDMTGDDRINLYIDSFNDKRNGYFFQVNSSGTRGDGLIENNTKFRRDWNGIWFAAARTDANGWTAEFAIPLKTLAYAENEDGVWGFECERIIRRKNEMTRFGTYARNRTPVMMAGIGELTGMKGLNGTGIDVKPSASIRQTHTRHIEDGTDRDDDTLLKASGDVFYKFHPSVTAGVTVNTDFLETPPDDQRNILTRFPEFLPERRAFFLQDAGIFEFGGLEGGLIPYRSRSIGRREGEPLTVDAGVKMTGRLDDLNFGGLYVHLPAKEGVKATDLAVARGQVNVLDGSAIGVIGTIGERDHETKNGLFGADFQFFDNQIMAGQVVKADGYFLQTVTDGSTSHAQALGLKVAYPNDRVSGLLQYTDVGNAFNPGLGGVVRPGIRQWNGNAQYRVRPGGWVRTADTNFAFDIVTNRSAKLESLTATFDFVTLENNLGDSIALSYTRRREHLRREPFEISPGVVIPLDDYSFDRYRAKIAVSNARPIQPTVEVVWGSFYSGDLFQVNAKLEVRPSRHIYFSFEFDHNDGDLDEGQFIQRLGRVRATVAFTPEISWANVVQYENRTKRMGFSSIFRWQVAPGNDVYAIFNYDWLEQGDHFTPTYAEGAIKVAWTFRF